jgi:hypothetical protein
MSDDQIYAVKLGGSEPEAFVPVTLRSGLVSETSGDMTESELTAVLHRLGMPHSEN